MDYLQKCGQGIEKPRQNSGTIGLEQRGALTVLGLKGQEEENVPELRERDCKERRAAWQELWPTMVTLQGWSGEKIPLSRSIPSLPSHANAFHRLNPTRSQRMGEPLDTVCRGQPLSAQSRAEK